MHTDKIDIYSFRRTLLSASIPLTKPICSKDRLCFFVKAEKKRKEVGCTPPTEGNCFLHILHGGSEEALLGNLGKPPHTAITEAM